MDDLEGKLTGRPSLSACTENLPIQPITRFGLLLVSKKKKDLACCLHSCPCQAAVSSQKKKKKEKRQQQFSAPQAAGGQPAPPPTGHRLDGFSSTAASFCATPLPASKAGKASAGRPMRGPPRRPLELVERLARAAVQLLG